MASTHRLGLAVLTAFSTFFLLIALLTVWNGWFLPEPQYTAYSYDEVVKKEITLSLTNLLIDVIVLFLPIYIISFFFKISSKEFTLKRFSVILAVVLTLNSLIIARTIFESLQLWQPLEQSTRSLAQRTFTRGRGGGLGLQKTYFVEFVTSSPNLSFIEKDIIPTLGLYGYSVSNYGITIARQQYTSVYDEQTSRTGLEKINLHEVPFSSPLSELDYANINFFRSKPYDSIDLITDNYRSDGMIKGALRAYY